MIKKILPNIILCSGVLLAVCLCLEGIFRLNAIRFSEGYRPSNDETVYELYPGYHIRSLNAKISRQGLNDRYFTVRKPSGVIRIAVVGDSTSFGWRVGQEKSFPKIFEAKLLSEKPGAYEVLNFSVPGYNTAEEEALLRHKVLSFGPDIVILVFSPNDTAISNWFKPLRSPLNFLYRRSFFVHWVLERLDRLLGRTPKSIRRRWVRFKGRILGMYYPKHRIYPFPGLEEAPPVGAGPPSESSMIPERYRYMAGYENYKKHLSAFARVLEKNNIRFISTGFFSGEAAKINQDLNVRYKIDFYDAFLRAGVSCEQFQLSGDDLHMNVDGHRLISEYLYGYMVDQKII